MKKINSFPAFSLIEVIIAAGILSVTVFGVYKLIGENTKLISNAGNYIQLNSLFPVLQECITSKTITGFSSYTAGMTLDFSLGSSLDTCTISSTPVVKIDNLEYFLKGKILEMNSDNIKWELSIEGDGIQKVTRTFIQR